MQFLLLPENERWTWKLTDDEGRVVCVSAASHPDRDAAAWDMEQFRMLAPTAPVVEQPLADEAPPAKTMDIGFGPPLQALLGHFGALFDRHYLLTRAKRSVLAAREVADANVQLVAEAGAIRAHSARVRQHSAAVRGKARATPPSGPDPAP